MDNKLTKKCRKCGERLPLYESRCYRCRSCDPVVMTVIVGSFILCNATLGLFLAILISKT